MHDADCGVMLHHMVATLSDPTLGLLVETIDHEYSKDQILTLLLRADLRQYEALGQGGSSKQGLIRKHICGAQDLARSHGDIQAHRALLDLVRLLIEDAVGDPQAPPAWFGTLCEALLADGFELTWTREEKAAEVSDHAWISRRPEVIVTYRILPTDSGPVPLPQEISAFENELMVRQYDEVLIHYRQAVSNFEQHNAEASNSQLRSALEALVLRLATEKANWVASNSSQGGGPAINHLISSGLLPERDGGRLLHGLWQISHTNGSHPGQSDADEARTRMQLVTATGRFLLRHLK